MAGWTIETLKEYLEALMKERDVRLQQRFEAGERRLDGMNEFRDALSDAQKTYITKSEAMSMIFAACSITSAVCAVVGLIAAGMLAFFLHK